MVGWYTNDDELESILKEAVIDWLRYYPSIFPEELRKTVHNLSQNTSVRVEIRSEHLPSTSPKHYL
jgi:hypothetical protein